MPPFGVAATLVNEDGLQRDLFRFWLLSHSDTNVIAGSRFWCMAVLRVCLPAPETALVFEAAGVLL